jgi:lipopolysaccharide/colanic/teichoic acid biosynthesis glycosyltransferase
MTTLGLHTIAPRLREARRIADERSETHPHAREGARRALNVVVAAIGLIVAAPVMLVVAVLVKLTSPGPVFYTQTRIGLCTRTSTGGNFRRRQDLGGKPFTIFKFRTMRVAEPGRAAEVWASQSDPRITPIGAFLRKTRLDELPQLFNVLRGDMNIVGPRPEQPSIFQDLRAQIPQYAARQQVRPGITGQAQITLHYDTCLDDVRKKVEADLEYIGKQSLLEDLRIMTLTAPVVILRKGGW